MKRKIEFTENHAVGHRFYANGKRESFDIATAEALVGKGVAKYVGNEPEGSSVSSSSVASGEVARVTVFAEDGSVQSEQVEPAGKYVEAAEAETTAEGDGASTDEAGNTPAESDQPSSPQGGASKKNKKGGES